MRPWRVQSEGGRRLALPRRQGYPDRVRPAGSAPAVGDTMTEMFRSLYTNRELIGIPWQLRSSPGREA